MSTETETVRTVRDVYLDFHTAPVLWQHVQRCFTSTETVRTIRDGEPRTSTSTFTQPLCSDNTFNVALRPRRLRPCGLLGTENPGRPPRCSHSPCALTTRSMLLYVHRDRGALDFHTAPEFWGLLMMMSWCLMSSDVIWHIRDKLWPIPKHGSIKSTYVRCMRV